jgi:hypothetical protein
LNHRSVGIDVLSAVLFCLVVVEALKGGVKSHQMSQKFILRLNRSECLGGREGGRRRRRIYTSLNLMGTTGLGAMAQDSFRKA